MWWFLNGADRICISAKLNENIYKNEDVVCGDLFFISHTYTEKQRILWTTIILETSGNENEVNFARISYEKLLWDLNNFDIKLMLTHQMA